MSETQELTFKRRKNLDGKPSIAPFIGRWNVWDIPSKEWTEAVQEAIKRAYELGWSHCNEAHRSIDDFEFPMRAEFKEQK